MTIKYTLVNNLLAGSRGFRALVQHARSVGMDEVVDLIIRQGSTVTRTDILGVLEGYHTAVENLLLEGARVNTPLANYGVSVKGVFEDGQFDFDPASHQVAGSISPGKRLKAVLRSRSQVTRVSPRKPVPMLLQYTDVNSGEQDGAVTPGGMGRLVGHWLQFDPADPAQGVFFVAESGAETRVEVVGHNAASRLMFLVPGDLPAGTHTLEVRVVVEGRLVGGALNATLTV